MSVQHVNSNHAWVHGVWVFLHGSSGNGFPWVAGNRNPNQTLKNMHVNEASFVTCRIILYKCNFRENYFPKHWPKDESGGFIITLNSSRLRPVSCAQAVWCPQSLAAASSAIFPTYPCPLSSHCFWETDSYKCYLKIMLYRNQQQKSLLYHLSFCLTHVHEAAKKGQTNHAPWKPLQGLQRPTASLSQMP